MKKTSGTWISCAAPLGEGGLGGHLATLVEGWRQREELGGYFARAGDGVDIDPLLHPVCNRAALAWTRRPPLRYAPGWRNLFVADAFDRAVAARIRSMDVVPDRLIAFGGQALHSFRAARSRGVRSLWLQAANSHVDNVRDLHARARRRDPIEPSWLNAAQARKTRAEYQMADRIVGASAYTLATFTSRGFHPEKLRRIDFPVASRFCPPPEPRAEDGVFRVVFVGSATVMKGLPLLLDAFAAAELDPRFHTRELFIVGGPASRGMRRRLDAAVAADPRIHRVPGDPLPHLHRADVLAHPSWEDGWAYAPAEALACGVPVVVTEDTGMKEIVRGGENGFVVPTGDATALASGLSKVSRRDMGGPVGFLLQPAQASYPHAHLGRRRKARAEADEARPPHAHEAVARA